MKGLPKTFLPSPKDFKVYCKPRGYGCGCGESWGCAALDKPKNLWRDYRPRFTKHEHLPHRPKPQLPFSDVGSWVMSGLEKLDPTDAIKGIPQSLVTTMFGDCGGVGGYADIGTAVKAVPYVKKFVEHEIDRGKKDAEKIKKKYIQPKVESILDKMLKDSGLSGGFGDWMQWGDKGGINSNFFRRRPIISGINPDGSVMGGGSGYFDRGGVARYAVASSRQLGNGVAFTNLN